MNSENSKTSEPHRLLLNLADKINLKGSEKCVALSNLSMYYKWKNIKKLYKNSKSKTKASALNEILIYLINQILYQIFKIISNISLKNAGKTGSPSKEIDINKIENRITFKIRAGYSLELLTT